MTIEFANRLAELRKEKGLSQEDLAEKLGVSRQAVSKWERGEATPDSDNLIALSSIYGVSLDELVHQKNPQPKEEKIEVEAEHVINPGAKQRGEETGPSHKRLRTIEAIVTPTLALVVTLVYILLGFLLDASLPDPWVWEIGWVFYLLVPSVSAVFGFIRTKNYEHLCGALIPIVVMAYVFLGMLGGYWHPGWVVFLVIPVFSVLCEALNKKASK